MLGSTPSDTVARASLIDALCHVLGNTCRIARIAKHHQWNAAGPGAIQAEARFRDQADELLAALDQIAEHIRTIGGVAVLDYTDVKVSADPSTFSGLPVMPELVQVLVESHHEACLTIEAAIDIAEEAADRSSIHLLTDRLGAHRRHAWRTRMMIVDAPAPTLPPGQRRTIEFGRS